MTRAIQEDFARDVTDCLELAAAIGENTDNIGFVAQQMRNLQAFLQQKQNQVEERLKIEIAEDGAEVERLKKRIDAISSGEVSEADIDPRNPVLIWQNLKNTPWTELYNFLILETTLPVAVIVEELLKYLRVTVELTRTRVKEARSGIMFQVMFPGEDPSLNKDLRLPKEHNKKEQNLYKDLEEFSTNCHHDSQPFCLPSIQKEILSEIIALKHFRNMADFTDQMQRARDRFVNKCIEFAWVAIFNLDDVKLVTDPVKQCPEIKAVFEEWDNVVRKQLLVEWPALVCDNRLVVKWVVSATKQQRQTRKLQKLAPVEDDPRIQDPEIMDDRRIATERSIRHTSSPVHLPSNGPVLEDDVSALSENLADVVNYKTRVKTAMLDSPTAIVDDNKQEKKGVVPNKHWPSEVVYKLKKPKDDEHLRVNNYSPTRGKYYESLPGGLQF